LIPSYKDWGFRKRALHNSDSAGLRNLRLLDSDVKDTVLEPGRNILGLAEGRKVEDALELAIAALAGEHRHLGYLLLGLLLLFRLLFTLRLLLFLGFLLFHVLLLLLLLLLFLNREVARLAGTRDRKLVLVEIHDDVFLLHTRKIKSNEIGGLALYNICRRVVVGIGLDLAAVLLVLALVLVLVLRKLGKLAVHTVNLVPKISSKEE